MLENSTTGHVDKDKAAAHLQVLTDSLKTALRHIPHLWPRRVLGEATRWSQARHTIIYTVYRYVCVTAFKMSITHSRASCQTYLAVDSAADISFLSFIEESSPSAAGGPANEPTPVTWAATLGRGAPCAPGLKIGSAPFSFSVKTQLFFFQWKKCTIGSNRINGGVVLTSHGGGYLLLKSVRHHLGEQKTEGE